MRWFVITSSLILVTAFVSVVGCAKKDSAVKPNAYNEIAIAMGRGNIDDLPNCSKTKCPFDINELASAVADRIQWKLENSLVKATLCEKEARNKYVYTQYACAQLINADAAGLFGVYGEKTTFPVLIESIKQLYLHRAFGLTGSMKHDANIARGIEFKQTYIPKPSISYDNSVQAINIFGRRVTNYGAIKTIHSSLLLSAEILFPSAVVKINGEDFSMRVDTNSQGTGLYPEAARRAKVYYLKNFTRITRDGSGKVMHLPQAILRSFVFANVNVSHMVVDIFPKDSTTRADGVIGLDVLDKMHAFEISGNKLILHRKPPKLCSRRFSIGSDFGGDIYGIIAHGTTFNGHPAIAVLDTGNSTAAISATQQFAWKYPAEIKHKGFVKLSSGGGVSILPSGVVNGLITYMGLQNQGKFLVLTNYRKSWVDFNIGAPYIYNKDLYIDFDDMKMCIK